MESASNHRLSPCRPIIVLGVDRSGTSLTSELIYRWGAHAGDLDLHLPANDLNPQGFWEYRPMQDFLNELHGSAGMWEWRPAFKELMRARAYEGRYRERALALIAAMEAAGKPWFWKEPGLCLSLPFWEKIWKQPIYVVVFRNPQDSAKSFEKMFVPPSLQGKVRITSYFALRWQHFMLEALDHAERNQDKIFVRYEQLLRSPVEQCRRLGEFLDRQCGLANGAEDRLLAMLEAINPALWRQKQGTSFFDLPEVSQEQKELFRLLEAKAADPLVPFDPARFPFPNCAQEYLENLSVFMAFFEKQASGNGAAERARLRGLTASPAS